MKSNWDGENRQSDLRWQGGNRGTLIGCNSAWSLVEIRQKKSTPNFECLWGGFDIGPRERDLRPVIIFSRLTVVEYSVRSMTN